jgi:hypothetical protein
LVQEVRDTLGPDVIVYFECNLPYGGVPPDIDRRYVTDQTTPLGYSPRDPGELAYTVWQMYTVRVVECQEINPLKAVSVPARGFAAISRSRNNASPFP